MCHLIKSELIHLLQVLLEGERAGALIASDTLSHTNDSQHRVLLEKVRRGESESYRRVRDCIKYLGGVPSTNVSKFYNKVLGIKDIEERLLFIERGQQRVIDKIIKNLDAIEFAFVRRELSNVLDIHINNSKEFGAV